MKSKLTSSSVKYKSSLLTMPTTCTQDSYLKLAEVIFALNVDMKLSVLSFYIQKLMWVIKILPWSSKPNDDNIVTILAQEGQPWGCPGPDPCPTSNESDVLSWDSRQTVRRCPKPWLRWGLPWPQSKIRLTKKSLPDSLFQIWHKSLLLFAYMPFKFAKIYPKYRYMKTIFRKMSLMQKSWTTFWKSNPF